MTKTVPTYLAAGIPRSGSTWMFNALRLFLNKKYDRVYTAWVAEIDEVRAAEADAVLIKLHDPAPALAATASRIFTSHRDLRDIVVSLRDMGWANDQAKMIEMATKIRGFHDFWSGRAALDIRYADIIATPEIVLSDIAKACEFDFTAEELATIGRELATLDGDPELRAVHDAMTLMHAKHRFDGRPNRFVDALARGTADEIVALHGDWLDRMGYDLTLQPA